MRRAGWALGARLDGPALSQRQPERSLAGSGLGRGRGFALDRADSDLDICVDGRPHPALIGSPWNKSTTSDERLASERPAGPGSQPPSDYRARGRFVRRQPRTDLLGVVVEEARWRASSRYDLDSDTVSTD